MSRTRLPEPKYIFKPGDRVGITGIAGGVGAEHEDGFMIRGYVIRNAESVGGQVGFCDVLITTPCDLDARENCICEIPVEELSLLNPQDSEFDYGKLRDCYS